MDFLFVIGLRDYESDCQHSKRPSVRAVIVSGGKLAMVYSEKFGYYKLPGVV